MRYKLNCNAYGLVRRYTTSYFCINNKNPKTMRKKNLKVFAAIVLAASFFTLASQLYASVVVHVSGCVVQIEGLGEFKCEASSDDCFTYIEGSTSVICTGEMSYVGN